MEQMGEMSDLCMYDLEDIIWDEFDRNDDHIVPHQSGIEPALKGDRCKKRRREVIDISFKTSDRSTSEYANQGKGDEGFQILKNTRVTMLEKDSWSHTPEGVFLASRDDDMNKEVTSLASHNTRISNRCFKSSKEDTIGSEFCDDGPLIGGRNDMVDVNSYCCSLGDISQTDNDLSFYSNYDDVVFSCDSMFGNEDELSWFTSPHNIEGSEGVLTPDFKFLESSLFKDKPEQQEQYSSVNDSNLDSSSMSYKPTFPASEDGEPEALGDWTFMNGSYPVSESNGEFTTKEQVIFHENEANQRNKSDGKRKDRDLDNVPFRRIGNEMIKDTKLPSGNSSHQVFTSPDILEEEESLGPDSFGYLENHIPCMISDYSHSSDQVPGSSTSTGTKSKTNGHGSLSAKESSYASNPVGMERYHDYSFQAPSTTMDGERKNMPRRQGFQPSFSSNPKHVDLLVRTAPCKPIPVLNHVHHSQNEVEHCSNVKGAGIRMPADLFTSSVQEVSSISSGCEKIEASSFHRLQQVMEQLDISTKLCIRDSLYRLARSAEQRHHDILNVGSIGDRDSGGALLDEGTDNCDGFMEIETDTNPIDRSIAHLLFHRPTDSSVMPTRDCSSLKSNTKIQGSITSPPVISEKLFSRDKTACEADNGD